MTTSQTETKLEKKYAKEIQVGTDKHFYYWRGIVSEDDIEAAIARTVSILGPPGNFVHPDGIGVTVETDAHGKIWYGDISSDLNSIQRLANVLGVPVRAEGGTGFTHRVYPES